MNEANRPAGEAAPPQGAWIVPDWPAPVRAAFTLRWGGISRGPFGAVDPQDQLPGHQAEGAAGFNLGDHVGDLAEHVAHNRLILQRHLGVRPVYLRQVHGTEVADLDGENVADGACADAALTSRRGTAAAVLVADCLPVLLCSADGAAVAAVHCGWRGLAAGVLETAVARLRERLRSLAADPELLAWLGPCIGPQAFEVGEEVRKAFVSHCPQDSNCFEHRTAGANAPVRLYCDLTGLARARLQRMGVVRVASSGHCTYREPERFYSHRRATHLGLASTGRMLALVWKP